MKGMYWKPQQRPPQVIALVAMLAIFGLFLVERFQIRKEQPHYRDKISAARLAKEAFDAVKEERLRRHIAIDREVDPSTSGIIGVLMSEVTSNTGNLSAKQTTINPNFAAVVLQWLRRAGVESGDTVAVAYSGSFPALNIAVSAALQVLKVKPIIVSSIAASQFGANHPDFLWIDIEAALFERRIFPFRSAAASIGGIEDRGVGISKTGKQIITQAIERNGVPLIKEKSFLLSLDRHMEFYQEQAQGSPIKVFINVGGGATSVGSRIGKKLFRPGLNLREPSGGEAVDSVMTRFVRQGVSVIHLIQVERLAKTHGLEIAPKVVPKIGEGKIYFKEQYNLVLANAVLLIILAILYGLLRSDWSLRLFEKKLGKE